MLAQRSTTGDLAERLSYVQSLEVKAGADDYTGVKTPEALEDGALRDGDAPVYTSPEVLALCFQYAAVGVVYGGMSYMKYPILTGYFKLEGNVLNSASALMQLGWSLKVFFGMLTDCFPIWGYNRKPYIFIGWLCTAIILVFLAIKPAGEPAPEPDSGLSDDGAAFTNGTVLALLCAVACFSYIMADVAQDALLVQYAQREPAAVRGRLQSMIYATRTVFMAIMSGISGFCLNSHRMAGEYDWDIGVNGYFWVMAVPTAINVPVVWFFLKDTKKASISVSSYFRQFWDLAQRRVVWQVMIFFFLFSLFTSYLGSTAGPYVSLYWAKVENINASIMGIVGNMIFAAVLIATGKIGTNWNWRWVLVLTTISANAIDAVVQFLTIFDVYRNQWFYLGVPLTEMLPAGIGFVIGTFVIVELAEDGNEGIMYGLLTTINNLPGVFGPLITNVVCSQFDVSKASIHKDTPYVHTQVAWTYAFAYSMTVVGCLWVFLLPNQKAAVMELKKTGGSYPRVAALVFFIFFAILAVSITGTMASMFEETGCTVIAGGPGCPPGNSKLYLLGIFVPCGTALAAIAFQYFR